MDTKIFKKYLVRKDTVTCRLFCIKPKKKKCIKGCIIYIHHVFFNSYLYTYITKKGY